MSSGRGLAVWSAVMVASTLLVLLFIFVPSAAMSVSWLQFWLWLLILTPVISVTIDAQRRRLDFLDLKHLLALNYLLQFCPNALYLLAGGAPFFPWLPFATPSSSEDYVEALAIATAGLWAFYCGTSARLGAKVGARLPTFSAWHIRRVPTIVCILVLWGVVSTGLLMSQYGGLGAFLGSLGSWRRIGVSGEGVLMYPAVGLLPLAPLILLLARPVRPSLKRRLTTVIMFIISLIPSLLLGFRGSIVPPLLQFFTAWHYRCSSFSKRQILIIGIILVMFLVAYGAVRENVERGQSGADLLDMRQDVILRSFWLRSPGLESFVIILNRLAVTGDYELGVRSAIETVTILVPRAIWPSKPESAGTAFGRDFMGDYLQWRDGRIGEASGGFSPTAPGYFYWQFAIPGVILGMFGLGILARMTYSYLSVDPTDSSRLLIYGTVMSSFPLIAESPQDGFNGLMIRWAFAVVLVWSLSFGRKTASRFTRPAVSLPSGRYELDSRVGFSSALVLSLSRPRTFNSPIWCRPIGEPNRPQRKVARITLTKTSHLKII